MSVFREKFSEAAAEMSWLVASVEYYWGEFIRSRVRRRAFSDVFQASVCVSDPKYGFLPEEGEEIMHKVALSKLTEVPTNSDEARDMAIATAYSRYRWGDTQTPD